MPRHARGQSYAQLGRLRIGRVTKLIEKRRVILDNAQSAPEFDAAALRVIDEEDERLGVFGSVLGAFPICALAFYEAQIPKTLTLREIRFNVVEPGRRTRTVDVITTLIDANEYTCEHIASLYGFRWNSELDIRSIKSNLNLEHVRCKSPEMVRRELWTTLLAYNLIRCTAAGAALLHDKQPRKISFTSSCQYVLASWMTLSLRPMNGERLRDYVGKILEQISRCEVANRPGRLEPRVVKRRPKPNKLMQKPRHVLRQRLRERCT